MKNIRSLQRGFTLIELSVVAIVAVVLAALAGKAMMDSMHEGMAEATGSYLNTLKFAMDDYATKNVTEITNNSPVTGFASPLAPTLDELKTAGHLTSAFPSTTPFLQTVTLTVTRSAACPNPGCLITSRVVANSPINLSGANIPYLVSILKAKASGYAIASSDVDPAMLSGPQCEPVANPLGSVPYVIGTCSVVNAGFWAQFVRRGDDRTTTLNNSLTVNGTVTSSISVVTGTITSVNGPIGTGAGSTGCHLAELMASGQILSRTFDCIARAIVDSDATDGGRVTLMNASNQQTVQLKGTGGQITAGDGTGTTVTIEGQQGRITTSGLTPGSLPTGFTGGVNTMDVAARGTVGAWDGTVLRATVGADGLVQARDGSGTVTSRLDGTTGRTSGKALQATDVGTIGAVCDTAGDQRQRADAAGAYVTCQNGFWVPLGARVVTANSACTIGGEYAIDASGQAMVCKPVGSGGGGFFVAAKYLLSDFVFVASSLVNDGTVITKPSCATVGSTAGVALIFLIPQTEGSSDGAFNRYAVDNGATWTVRLKRGDDSTALDGGAALAAQYCYYTS
jgi:prepilin-type N-terminal cleavage/methylation domain-containing protein